MLATRVIPTLLQRGSTLVKGKMFDSWRSVGHALQAVKIHSARAVDELIYLDIGATPEGRGPDFKMVERLTKDCFVPITVGGGVRSIEDVQGLLNAGADKVAICTAFAVPDVVGACADRFGSQAIVVAIDVKPVQCQSGERYVGTWAKCGTVPFTIDGLPMSPRTAAVAASKYGAGEILLTSIDRDGMMEGYDLALIKAVSEAVSIPVIGNGGCGEYSHMVEAVRAGASAVAAGAMFAFTDQTPRGASEYLMANQIEARV